MKYKFEVWKYGIFDYVEAENHLNHMAEKGWLYKGKALIYGVIGVYEKNENHFKLNMRWIYLPTVTRIEEQKIYSYLRILDGN